MKIVGWIINKIKDKLKNRNKIKIKIIEISL